MPDIRSLYHPDLPIDRRIEKVITFSNRQPGVLANEAREYVVTKNLGSEYSKLLNYFDDAQKGDRGGAECCVWLSGFYGSGKSSFAKYFGLVFDPGASVGDSHFSELFVKQFPDNALQTRFNTVRKNFEVAVFLLDLAAMGNAAVTHTPISTQLYTQVCSWAGFAPEAKIQQFEMKLQLDGKLEEYHQKTFEATGMPYSELRNLDALLLPTASRLAHEFYPNIWPNADSLQNSHSISTQTEQERVGQMLDLIKVKTGTQRVLFIVDEVGHFLRNNDALVNNLDGLAKNLKEIGGGKAWLVATAQETLPKTGPLFGLKDRFPIKIDLKPSDIREITHRRLLKKSTEGTTTLKNHFSASGQKLVLLTGLEQYPTEKALDEESFVEFYPLLPQLFDVLIDAIRSLARVQGGIGLRSAIRCVQDILIGINPSEPAVVDREVPALVTVADLYDVLQPDIASAAKDSVLGVDRIAQSRGDGSWGHRVAKAIALLQQIDGFPITRKNLTALLYPEVGAASIADEVAAAVDELIKDRLVPIGEDADGVIGFQSEAVSTIEKDRANIVVTSTHRLSIQNRLMREMFQKPPRVLIEGAKNVDAGISVFDGGREQRITDKDTDIRFLVEFVPPAYLEDKKNQLLTESLASTNDKRIYVAAPLPQQLSDILSEIHRAEEIRRINQSNTDAEVQRYVTGQEQFQTIKSTEVQQFLTSAIMKGWLVFKGNANAAATLGTDLDAALKAQLATAAGQVFNKFKCAAENVASTVAENFLRVTDLTQITRDRDPLSVVNIQGTDTNIDLSHPALVEITDFLERHPNPDGKRLLEQFSRPPHGWSKDTTRYLAAALFYAQRIKIRTNSQEVKVVGDLAFAAFKSNSSFNGVTILTNVSTLPDDVRQRAAKRLNALTGETIPALPQKIAEVAVKHIPKFVKEFTNLPPRVAGLGLPDERLQRLQSGLADAQMGDGSDAPSIFGAEDSELFDDIIWARKVAKALDHGAEQTLADIASLIGEAKSLATQGLLTDLPDELESAGSETLATVKNGTFFDDIPALGHTFDHLKSLVATRCAGVVEDMKSTFAAQVDSIRSSADYAALDDSQRIATDENLADLIFDCEPTPNGLLTANAKLNGLLIKLQAIRTSVQQAAKPKDNPSPSSLLKERASAPEVYGANRVKIPGTIDSEPALDAVIESLEAERPTVQDGKTITVQID